MWKILAPATWYCRCTNFENCQSVSAIATPHTKNMMKRIRSRDLSGTGETVIKRAVATAVAAALEEAAKDKARYEAAMKKYKAK